MTTVTNGDGSVVLTGTTLTDTAGGNSKAELMLVNGTSGYKYNLRINASNQAVLEMFDGASWASNFTFSGTGVTIPGTGKRITGDFSNATIANRIAIQTSTANSSTSVVAVPNGTGNFSQYSAYTTADPTNSSYGALQAVSGNAIRLFSDITGTGTYLPMTFWTGGSEGMRLTTNRNLLVKTTSELGYSLQVGSGYAATDTTGRAVGFFGSTDTAAGGAAPSGLFITYTGNAAAASRKVTLTSGTYGSGTSGTLSFNEDKLLLNTSGNLGLGVVPSAWSGVVPQAIDFQYGQGIGLNTNGTAYLSCNSYFNGTSWVAKTTGVGARLALTPDGVFAVGAQASVAAGAAQTNTNLLYLTSLAELSVGSNAVNSVYDGVAAARGLVVQKSSTATGDGTTTAAIAVVNGDTTTSNWSQINFAAITGAHTSAFSSGWIGVQHGARTNGQYPTGDMAFATSSSLNAAPTRKMTIKSTGQVYLGTNISTPVWDEYLRVSVSGNNVGIGAYYGTTGYTSSLVRLQTETAAGTGWKFFEGRAAGGAVQCFIDGDGSAQFTSVKSTTNSAVLKPNDGTFGSWKVMGSKGGWYGLEFESNEILMMNYSGLTNWVGFYRGGTGWRFYSDNSQNFFSSGGVTAATTLTASSGNIQVSNGYFYSAQVGYGLMGVYDSTKYQGIFTMGASWNLPNTGATTGNLYGMAWSHPNAGGAAANMDSHGMLVLINGGYASSMSYSIKASANVTAYSDERLKTNWRDLPTDFLDNLAKVKVGVYDRIDRGITQVGVSAQSLRPVMPEAVIEANDEIKTLSVAYGNAALAASVKLAEAIVELRAELKAVKAELAAIKNKE